MPPKKKANKKKPQKMWVYAGAPKESAKPTQEWKTKIQEEFAPIVEELKKEHVEEKPPHKDFNYIIDVKSKWYRNYFYLYSIYKCPGPNALSDTFESKFARLEYIAPDKFNLAFMRHTGQWQEVGFEVSLKECVEDIRSGGFFHP